MASRFSFLLRQNNLEPKAYICLSNRAGSPILKWGFRNLIPWFKKRSSSLVKAALTTSGVAATVGHVALSTVYFNSDGRFNKMGKNTTSGLVFFVNRRFRI